MSDVIYLTEDFEPVSEDDPRMVMVKVRYPDGRIVFGSPVRKKKVEKNQELFHSGGPGSGHHGHKGRLHKVGGSQPRSSSPSEDLSFLKGSFWVGPFSEETRQQARKEAENFVVSKKDKDSNGAVLVRAIRETPERSDYLARGMTFSARNDKIFSKLKPGDTFDVLKPSSWSTGQRAAQYATPRDKGVNGYLLEIEGSWKGIDINQVIGRHRFDFEQEVITHGRFKVKKVYQSVNGYRVIRVKQEGVW